MYDINDFNSIFNTEHKVIKMKTLESLFGTTHSSGKMQTVLNHSSMAVTVKNYGKAEIINTARDVNQIHDTHAVTIMLTNPLHPTDDPVVTEKHLVTSRYLESFKDIRIQG
jgi:hypothetical protein